MTIFKHNKWKLLPAFFVVMVGSAHSLPPHVLNLAKTGDPAYFADSDDTELYLNYSTHLLHHGGSSLVDPITNKVGTFVPDAQIIPFVALAKITNLDPSHIPVIWRLWAGLSIAIALYLLLFVLTESRSASALIAILLLADAGFLSASPFLRQLYVAFLFALGKGEALLSTFPYIHLQWRIITPGLSLAVLLLQIYFVVRARKKTQLLEIGLAGIFTGLLMYVYFYFWTAAFLALAVCFVVDRVARKSYLKITLIGLVLGAPAIFMNALMKQTSHADALPRLDFFLPIRNLSEFLIPKTAIVIVALIILLLRFLPTDRFPKQIFYFPAALAFAALLLLNHQLATGLQIQNFHYSYVYGPVAQLTFFAILTKLAIGVFGERRAVRVLFVLALFSVPLGFYSRAIEAKHTNESVRLSASYNVVKNLLKDVVIENKDSIIAGNTQLASLISIQTGLRPFAGMMLSLSPYLSNDEWNQRLALNAAIEGLNSEAFAKAQTKDALTYPWGKWGRDTNLRQVLYEERIGLFETSRKNLVLQLDEKQIRWVIANRNISGLPEEYSDSSKFRMSSEFNDWMLLERIR